MFYAKFYRNLLITTIGRRIGFTPINLLVATVTVIQSFKRHVVRLGWLSRDLAPLFALLSK